MAKAPLLSLITLEPVYVDIDGTAYELVRPDSFPIGEARRYMRAVGRMLELSRLNDPTLEQERAFSVACDEVCRMLLKAPDAVHAKLVDSQRFAIYNTFLGLSKRPQADSAKRTGRTTARRSRGSRGSTVSVRKNSSASASASSALTSR